MSFSIEALEKRLAERASASPEESYTARLVAAGVEKCAQKLGEEAVETVIAALPELEEDLSGAVGEEVNIIVGVDQAPFIVQSIAPLGEVKCTSPWEETSRVLSATGSGLDPSLGSACSGSSSCSSRYTMATSAPSLAYPMATARPMPLSPPVTRATLSASLPEPR